MFWPPSLRSNNVALVSDTKFVADTGGPARFAAYIQPATFLSPWLARTDQDTVWQPSDPMCRVILIGDPPSQLRSFNEDAVGAIVSLTSLGLGTQAWEVVSFFDWYQEGLLQKACSLAWARLWPGHSAPPLSPNLLMTATNGAIGHPAGTTSFAMPATPAGWFVVMVARTATGGPAPTVSLKGTPIAGVAGLNVPALNIDMYVFYAAVAAMPLVGTLDITDASAGNFTVYSTWWNAYTTQGGEPFWAVTGAASMPTIMTPAATTVSPTLSVFLAVETFAGAGMNYGPPVVSWPTGAGFLPGASVRAGFVENAAIVHPSASLPLELPAQWGLLTVSFH